MTQTFPLGVGDLYHLFLDRRMRAAGVGNGSQLLFELDGELDAGELRARLDALQASCPALGAGLESWPGYRWQVRPGHRIPLVVESGDEPLDALFTRHHGAPFPPPEQPGFHVVLARGEGRTALLLRWLHPLMDAPGADRLVCLLDGDDPARYRLHDLPSTLPRRARGGSWLRLAVAVHNFLLRYLARSLPPPRQARMDGDAGAPRVLAHTFDEARTAAIYERAAALAGGLEANPFFLGVAFVALARALGVGGGTRLLIPCPVNLRPRAWRGPVFANYFTSVLVQLPARRASSLPAAVDAVRVRFREALRRREEAATFWMMGLRRWLPHPLFTLLMVGPTARDPASLYYSYVELDAGRGGTLLGLPVRRCLAASQVLRPPGASLVFLRCAGRLTVEVPCHGFPAAERLLDEAVALLGGGD